MKKKIAVVAGGYSGEAEVSYNSAKIVEASLDKERYEITRIWINNEGWFVKDDSGDIPVDKNDFSYSKNGEKFTFDGVFVIIHGTPGEDGKLQGYFEMLNMPQSTCDSLVSALLFHKYYCNKVVRELNILKVAKSVRVHDATDNSVNHVIENIAMPCFVKPMKGGSSIGMSKVSETSEVKAALEIALKEDDEVLVEEFIDGTEVTCGVFMHKEEKIVLPLTEIRSKKEFFDYEAKYTAGMADEITPAPIEEEIFKEVQAISSRLYDELGCEGVVRFDYIFNKDGIYFLEGNTVPGMSAASIVPQQAEEYGYDLKSFFTMLVEDMFYRYKVER